MLARLIFSIVFALNFLICGFASAGQRLFIEKVELLASHPGLEEAVVKYYTAERDEAWFITYEMRTRAFQETFPYDVYAPSMHAANSTVQKIRVVRIVQDDQVYENRPIVVVEMVFLDQYNGEGRTALVGEVKNSENNIYENNTKTAWVLEGENWKCIICGVRLNFVLNALLGPNSEIAMKILGFE